MFWVIAFLPFFARPGRKHLFGVEVRYSMKTEVKCEMDLLGLWFNFWHKGLRVATLAYKAEALELQKQVRHIQSQFDMHTGQASSLIQGRRAQVAATSTVNGHHTDLDDSLSARNLELHFGGA